MYALYIGSHEEHFKYGYMYQVEIQDEEDFTIVRANGIQYFYETYEGVTREWKIMGPIS